ncbi:MAG: MoaD family protein [Candidatus Bathyarchaeia archaeon]
MVKVKIRTIGPFAELLGFKEKEIEVQGNTVKDLMDGLKLLYGKELMERIIDESKGEVKPFIKVLVNGIGIDALSMLNTELKDGDVVAIFPPVGGGTL